LIREGLQVQFEIAPGYKGPQAVNINILKEESTL
jgi:Cold shock proteins